MEKLTRLIVKASALRLVRVDPESEPLSRARVAVHSCRDDGKSLAKAMEDK
jgi:hypothetical protein